MPGNIATIPPEVAASWPIPDYVDPERRTWLTPVAITFHALSTLLVFTRVWLRSMKTVGGLGLDDALLIPAWLFATASTVLVTYATQRSFVGLHIWDVIPGKFANSALIAWLNQFSSLLGTGCLNVSVLLFCRRMVNGSSQRRWHYAIFAVIAFTVAYTFALCVVLICNCSPTKAYWKAYDLKWATSHDFKCVDTRPLNPLAGVLAIISDIYSIVIPCVVCWKLQISVKQKVGLYALFAVSFLTIGAAGGRTWALYRVGGDYDASWHAIWIFFWGVFEYELGIICTCIPTLRALFKGELVQSRLTSSRAMKSGYFTPGSTWKSSGSTPQALSRANTPAGIPMHNRSTSRLDQKSALADDKGTIVTTASRGSSWLDLD